MESKTNTTSMQGQGDGKQAIAPHQNLSAAPYQNHSDLLLPNSSTPSATSTHSWRLVNVKGALMSAFYAKVLRLSDSAEEEEKTKLYRQYRGSD